MNLRTSKTRQALSAIAATLIGVTSVAAVFALVPVVKKEAALVFTSPATQNSQLATVSGAGSGLVAHYTFDDGTAADVSGNGNSGTVSGATQTTGKVGSGAMQFDGVDDHVNINSVVDNVDVTQGSMSVWIKGDLNHVAEDGIFEIGRSGSTNDGIRIRKDNFSSRIYGTYRIDATDTTISLSSVPSNVWHHLVYVWRTDLSTELYLNGVSVGTANRGGNISNTLTQGIIGADAQSAVNAFFPGYMDDVRLYNRALTASEIQELYTFVPANPSGTIENPPVTEPVQVSQPATQTNTYWHVDNEAVGTNSGTSWANAYRNFSAINWNTIKPGDTIYISGGTSQKIYTEGLSVGQSGTQSSPIFIKVGQDSGHNGEVIIDGATTGISLKMKQYITVDGSVNGNKHLTVRNSTGNGVYLGFHDKILYTNIIDNGHVSKVGSGVLIEAQADYWEIGHSVIRRNYNYAISQPSSPPLVGYGHNKVHHNEITDIAYDGMKGGLRNTDVYNNEIGRAYYGGSPGAHLDVFQQSNMQKGLYLRIYNNHIFDFNNSVTYFEVADGGVFDNFLFYNNVVEKSVYGGSDQGLFIGRGQNIRVTDVLIANNVFKNLDRPGVLIGGTNSLYGPNIVVANNIFIDNGSVAGTAAMSVAGGGTWGDLANTMIDGNLIFSGTRGSNKMVVSGVTYSSWSDPMWTTTYPQWTRNINGDPKLIAQYRPDANSPVINSGINLSQYANIAPEIDRDKDGVSRGSAWDIGAYEYVGSVGGQVQAPIQDTVIPVISSISAGSISTSGTTISWTTNEPATTQVQYGLTTAYGSQTPLNSTLSTSHTQQLTNLQPNTLYHYRLISKDAAGNTTTSSDGTFSTLALNALTQTPVVNNPPVNSITTPTNSVTQPVSLPNVAGTCTPTFASSTLPVLPSFTPALKFGSRGTNVSTLQRFLADRSYLSRTYITGYYGPLTTAAVTKYNRDRLTPVPVKTCPTTTTTTATSTYTFTRNLKVGMTGADVKALQQFLNSKGFQVSLTGAGSPGKETPYYGPATARAVTRFQEAYRAEVLTPSNLTRGTGYFGPSTRAKINSIQ